MSIYYTNEIRRGFANQGEYQLKDEYADYFMDADSLYLRESMSPEELVKSLVSDREKLQLLNVPEPNPDGIYFRYQMNLVLIYFKKWTFCRRIEHADLFDTPSHCN